MSIFSALKAVMFLLGLTVSVGSIHAQQGVTPTPVDYQAWYKKRLAYEKTHETLRQVVASVEDEEELLPASKQTIKQIVAAMGVAGKGLLGVPTQQEIYSTLFEGAVSRGQLSLMRFLAQECGVNPNAVVTLETPSVLHSLEVQKKYHLDGPYKVAQELFVLGLKPAYINSWSAQGETPLHVAIKNMIIAGSNSTVSKTQFVAGVMKSGIKFENASEAEEEYNGFIKLNKQRGQEWSALAKFYMAKGAHNLKNAQGKKIDDLLRESGCKADFCQKFSEHIKQLGQPKAEADSAQ